MAQGLGVAVALALFTMSAIAAPAAQSNTALRIGPHGTAAFGEPVSDWYFVLKTYISYYSGSPYCTIDALSREASPEAVVTCAQKATPHLQQFALVHSDSTSGPAETGAPLFLVSRGCGACGAAPDSSTVASSARHLAAESVPLVMAVPAEAIPTTPSNDMSVAGLRMVNSKLAWESAAWRAVHSKRVLQLRKDATSNHLRSTQRYWQPAGLRARYGADLTHRRLSAAIPAATSPMVTAAVGKRPPATQAVNCTMKTAAPQLATTSYLAATTPTAATVHSVPPASAVTAPVHWPWPPATDAGFRPVGCALSGRLSTFQLWRDPGVSGAPIDFDTDWLYLSVDGQFCTLADPPATSTSQRPALKGALSCHLPGANGASQFQLLRIAFPFAGFSSLAARGACGARRYSSPEPHDVVCGRRTRTSAAAVMAAASPAMTAAAAPEDDREYVYSLLLQKPAQRIVSGGTVGLYTFFEGLVGVPLQQCCPQAASPHVVQCSSTGTDATAKAVPNECWYTLDKVGGAAGAIIQDGDLIQIKSNAYSRYCSVSIDGSLLCVSASPSNASRNVFTLTLGSTPGQPAVLNLPLV